MACTLSLATGLWCIQFSSIMFLMFYLGHVNRKTMFFFMASSIYNVSIKFSDSIRFIATSKASRICTLWPIRLAPHGLPPMAIVDENTKCLSNV